MSSNLSGRQFRRVANTGHIEGEGGTFEFDRAPLDPDEKFGLSDHVTELPTQALARFRDKDVEQGLRNGPEYFEALVDDIRQHGVGNPVAVFHDQRRATLAEGNHRLAAAERLGLERLPARVIRLNNLDEVSTFAKRAQPLTDEERRLFEP